MPRRRPSRPLITLTSDFGLADAYVASMKAACLRRCPEAQLVDVSHLVPRHDLLAGSITLEQAVASFAPGTVHLAVVDPGVGTDRRMLIVRISRQTIVCPDNGLITWTWRRHGGGEAFELIWRPAASSHTFHGRDIMGPVAGMLAGGQSMRRLGLRIDRPILLDIAPAAVGETRGPIIHIDSFGNATTNIPAETVAQHPNAVVTVGRRRIGPVRRTYGDVEPGRALALIGSSDLLEVAVRNGSAADLDVRVGDPVRLG